MGDHGYPRFSDAELARRFGQVRELLAREGVEALLLHGGPSSPGPVHYLSGYLPIRPAWLLFALDGPSTLFLHFHNHVPNARAVGVVEDVRCYWPSAPGACKGFFESVTGLPAVQGACRAVQGMPVSGRGS